MYRKGFSVATIGIFLVSILAIFNPAAAVVPGPANYQVEEYAWLKEDGVGPDSWDMYNNTGWNRLNLSFKFSKCNLAYVARSAATADDFNVTFCVIYNDTTAGTGFNTTGHLFAGTQAAGYWNRTVPAVSTQTAGVYTYHLFITTFDPMGVPGDYQVRINETAPGSIVGSSWAAPAGTVVEWMFFNVPTAAAAVSVTDQLGRSQPFYLDGDSPSTQYNATMLIDPPGNSTGASTATFEWLDPAGNNLWTKSGIPIYYVPGEGWATQWVIAANTTFTPFNATHPYGVRVTMGSFVGASTFFVLSTQWINVEITVEPTMDQWFDPSSFLVTFTAILNTGVTANPYSEVSNLTLQFWDKVHVDDLPDPTSDGIPEWYGGLAGDPAGNPWFANLSWNITGYPVVDGSSYTYTYTKMIPATYIDNTTTSLGEFTGWYGIRSKDGVGTYPAVEARTDFWVDDPIEGYTSLEKATTVQNWIWEQKPGTVWVNVEYDPIYLASNMHTNDEYADKDTNITWYWNDYFDMAYIKPPGNDQTTMTQNSWPSTQFWAFSTASVNSSFPITGYDIVANATCDTGYVVRELIQWNVVYRVLYLEIWPKWEEYQPCMKKSIVGKTYYLDEDENEVPVEWGFMETKMIDPNGITYLAIVDEADTGEGLGQQFAWTVTRLIPDETEALGAVWDEIPSDAEEGTWTIHAMALGIDDDLWEYTGTQVVDIGGVSYSFVGPATTTFEVTGTDVHLMIDGIVDSVDEGFNLTWEVLADILANQDEMAAANEEDFAAVLAALEDVMDDLVEMGADIDSINDYVREIRALTQRIDRWRTESAEAMADHLMQVLDAVEDVNNNVNAKWADFGNTFQNSIFGVSANDPRSLSYKIANVRTSVQATVVDSLNTMIAKMDTINAGLAGKLTTILNAIYSESGGLDESIRSEIKANINYAISSIREKVDQSTATLGSKVSSAADGLHGKFSGVIAEIGHVSDKVDVVNAKLGGVENNIADKVDTVDASMGTRMLVAIILIVIVLILVLLPIVAPGFRMKE
jgi:hypothetical protein